MIVEQLAAIKNSQIFDYEHYLKQLGREEADQLVACGGGSNNDNIIAHYISSGDSRRISPHPIFDTDYYYSTNPDVSESNITALFHFLKYGWKEARNPHPMFDTSYVKDQISNDRENPLLTYIFSPPGSFDPHPFIDEKFVVEQLSDMQLEYSNVLTALLCFQRDNINPSRHFDTARYLKTYPDLRENSPTINALYHYIRYGQAEGRWTFPVSASLNGIEEQINEICLIEPNVIPADTSTYDLPLVFSKNHGHDLKAFLTKLLNVIGGEKCDFVYLVPHLRKGGAERVLANFLHAHLSISSQVKIAVITTDSAINDIGEWLPRHKNLIYTDVSDYRNILTTDGGLKVLSMVFGLIRCSHLFVLNSYIGWTLIENYGAALAQQMQLNGFAFCYDYDREQRRFGYAWTHLRDCLPYLSKVITDNKSMINEFERDLRLNEKELDKFIVIKQPAPLYTPSPSASTSLAHDNRARNVLWASRIEPQKHVDMAIEIARDLPDIQFFIAGGPISNIIQAEHIPRNCVILGDFSNFTGLMSRSFDLFLYTAKWDGIPNILLEAAAHGLAIVASNVGGVAEVITSETGWIVNDFLRKEAFTSAVIAALNDDAERCRRTKNMHRLLSAEHNWELFRRRVAAGFHQEMEIAGQ